MNNGVGEEQDAGGNGEDGDAIIPNPNVDPNGGNDDANQDNDGQGNRGQ